MPHFKRSVRPQGRRESAGMRPWLALLLLATTLADQTLDPTRASGAPVVFTPQITDNLSSLGTITASCVNQRGAPFVSGQVAPIGATTITCTATDLAGNTASSSFTVTVRSVGDLVTGLRADTISLVTNPGAERALTATLDQALRAYSHGNQFVSNVMMWKYVVQVSLFVRSHALTPAAAQQLLQEAQQIMQVMR